MDTYGLDQVSIHGVTIADRGELIIVFSCQVETLFYCPGISVLGRDERNLVISFVRASIDSKPDTFAAASLLEDWQAKSEREVNDFIDLSNVKGPLKIIEIHNLNAEDIYIFGDGKKVRIWPPEPDGKQN